jgi:hypothetical protein
MQIRVEGVPVKVDDNFKNLSPEEQDKTVDEIAASEEFKKARPAPETTVDDIGTGIKSGIATGAVAAIPAIPAFAADLPLLPGHIASSVIDWGAGKLGYDPKLHEQYSEKFGEAMPASKAVGRWASGISDTYLADPPKSAGGKIARAVTSAGVEALAGSGVFKVAGLAGKFFTNYDDAVAAAKALGVNPALSIQAVKAAESAAKGPVAQTAYSAASGGGAEIAEQKGVNPLIGAALGLATAATGHAAVPAVRSGVRAAGEAIDETLTRTPEIRDRKAAEALRGAAKDPDKLDEWARSGETGELVQGSKPTLYEAVGEDRGIGALQREQRMGNPVYKIEEEERRAAQNVARVEELKRLGGEGTHEEILTEFRKQRDEMDARTAAAEQTAQGAAATAAQRAGTTRTAEEIGEAIRTPVAAVQRDVTEVGNKLYRDIEDQGVTVGTGRLKAAIGKAFQDFRENPLAGREREIADIVRGYGDRVDFKLLRELRKDVASRARNQNLPDAEIGRAKFLRKAIDRAMDDGLARALKEDPTVMQRAAASLDEEARRLAEAWNLAPPPQGRVPPPVSTAVEPIDDALTEEYRAANRHWAQNVKQPYEAAPVKGIVAEAPTPSGFKMTEAQVPEAAFRPGNTGGEKIRAMRAAGATDDALSEAAALSLQQTAMRDGVIDPQKFRNWVDRHLPAIRELPPAVQQRFSSASTATRALEAATAARKAALKDFDESAVGKALGIPVENLQKAISSYLENPNATNQLAAAVANNPAAKAGLQRLAADNILGSFRNASDDLSKAALTTWIDRNMKQLKTIYGAENARRFQRLVDDIERSRRQMTVGKDPAGPGTAGDIAQMGKRAMGATVMSIISAGGGPKGLLIAGVVGAGKAIGAALKTAGLQSVDEVLAQALLNPELARKLLTKAPALKNEKFLKGLGSTILRSSVAGMAYGGNQ